MVMMMNLSSKCPWLRTFYRRWMIYVVWMAVAQKLVGRVQASSSCAFHAADGVAAESEGVRFIRLREDTKVGKEILWLRAYSHSNMLLKSPEGSGDHKYFALAEVNSTTVLVTLARSLENLVDRDVPRNLLKFRIMCAGKNEKIEEGSYMSITVYIEDINDNAPEFLNTPYIVDVDENTPSGSIVFEGIQAFDRDKPNTPNSEVHFSMSTVPEQLSADGSPFFALKSPHRPLLVLKRELDFDNGIRLFKLPLFVWDRGTPANQANTTITINVRDVDDLPPKFTEGVYRTKINEFYPMTSIPIRVPLYFSPPIMAYDQDSLNASLVYDIISGNERQLFRVNSNNGVIYLQKEIDLEEESLPGNTFVLQIEARQRENPLKKALARIEVEILDLNDNLPEFEADFYNISIVENLPSGFSVLQVNAIDRDQGENSEFLYNLIEEDVSAGAFRIDSRSGWITVRDDRLLDREVRKSIHLIVQALERNEPFMLENNMKKWGPSSVRVEITLLDTNDNTPKFVQGNLYEFKVSVTSPVGHKVGQVTALDPDEGPNGKLVYDLQRPKGSGYVPFRLDSKNGTIYVAGPLRRGRIAVFVEASDQPTNPSERRFSLAVITIEVYSTIDDQAIDFVGAPYEFWVGSNVPLGTSVGQVRTTLIYEGEDEIMYDLLHTYSEGVPFAIEERSGIITVIRELKEFTRKLYFFEAVANYLFANSSQRSTPSPLPLLASRRTSEALTTVAASELPDEGVLITNVTIHVVGKPENRIPLRPVIEEINMNVIKFHVEENLVRGVIGQLLYKNGINIINNDLGTYGDTQQTGGNITLGSHFRNQNARLPSKFRRPRRLIGDSNIKLRYIIANQQEVHNKITITEDGTLLTLTGLDREEKDNYDLTVIVEYSSGHMSGAGIYQVSIKVDDVNDNAPKFNGQSYVGLIRENSAIGTEVAINQPIQISDADEGRNAEFRVIVQGDSSDIFAITQVVMPQEHENASRHSVPILETFNIFNLTDQWNDELQYTELQKTFMHSNLKPTAGHFFRITYIGKRSLDREKDQLYNLKVMAVDSGGLTGYATLTILVADVNDNAPVFERISVFKDSKVEIREYNTDMEIYFVAGSSSSPTMAMPESLPLPPYHIPGSPRLNTDAFSSNNTGFAAMQYRLRPRSRGRSRMRVTRRAIHPPFRCPIFALLEDTPLTTTVLQLSASDEDFGKNAQVYYAITGEQVDRPAGSQYPYKLSGAQHFSIDQLSGELVVNQPLTANIDVYLNVSATDIDGLKDTTCLHFTVIDVNNYAPVFKKSWYSFESAEGIYNDSVLGQVLAVDLDYGKNANITYALSEADIPFTIKPVSGVIKINGTLDREERTKYSFHVIAMDGAEAPYRLSSSVEVEVNVVDVNDNKPQFIGYDDWTSASVTTLHGAETQAVNDSLLPVYKAYIDRSTNPGMFVKQVTAIDKDYVGNGNGLVLYSISHQSAHPPIFQIDSRDGTITTVTNFKSYNDYEHLNVTVIASDLGSPVHSSTAIVLVNLQEQAVTEPNENRVQPEEKTEPTNVPLFQHQYYEVQITENNETPIELMKINLTTELPPETYRWSLQVEDEAIENDIQTFFEVRPSGSLYALISFDRESVERYQLRVRVERVLNREARTYPKLTYPVLDERIEGLELNECRIVITILDENDNSPKFEGNGRPIVAVVPRAASFDYPVTTVVASDPDDGLNAEIRYRLLNERSQLFGIDELSGKIRLMANVPEDERVYGFDVKATDRSGAEDGRSSIANVFVYVIDEKRQVRIVIAGKPVEVEKRIDALMEVLSEALQMDLRVRLLEPHEGGTELATDAYVYAVDYRTNSVTEMEQLQDLLGGLQLDNLQLQQKQSTATSKDTNEATGGGRRITMPRIIELAEFGQLAHAPHASANFMGGIEVIIFVLIALCAIGATMTAICFLCLRQKRDSGWRQHEFPSSETGLTYTIARAGASACRRHYRHRNFEKCTKSTKTNSSNIPESICSSIPSQSTAATSQKLEQHVLHHHRDQHQHHQHHQPHQHHQHHQHQHHQQYNNNRHLLHQPKQAHSHQNEDYRSREYIDVPLPKSVVKANAINRCASQDDEQAMPFVLKYNSSQPVNHLSLNPYEASMLSIYSSGQDSGVGFPSNRDLYETSPDSLNNSQAQQLSKSTVTPLRTHGELLCPRHANEAVAAASAAATATQPGNSSNNHDKNNNRNSNNNSNNNNNNNISTDSSDNCDESLKNSEALTATPTVSSSCMTSKLPLTGCERHRHIYQNTNFEKRSCVRHSFSGFKDDLTQNSPRMALRSRGHTLRNSMNDLEERLHNLEQSFRRPNELDKSNSIY